MRLLEAAFDVLRRADEPLSPSKKPTAKAQTPSPPSTAPN